MTTKWLGNADIETYRETLQGLREADTTGWHSEDIGRINAMKRDCEYSLEWLETGRRPGNRRGVERLAAYQREIPVDVIEKYMKPPEPLVIDKDRSEEWIHAEYIMSMLSDRERECYEMLIGGMCTDSEIAELLGISRRSVRTMLERAETKIKKYKRMPTPLYLDIAT